MSERKQFMPPWGAAVVATIGSVMLALFTVGIPMAQAAAASPQRPHAVSASTPGDFWLATPAGNLYAFGVPNYGSPGAPLNRPIVTVDPTRGDAGYWMVASDGGVFSYGDAHFFGSTGNIALNKPIVSMAPTPDQQGYWLVASDGGVFSFGDAHFFGSTGNIALNKPIVSMTPTSDGKGYWLVASDGGVFSFGDAVFHGSTGGIVLNKPIVSMDAMPNQAGYWLLASDGGVFAFGDATFHGSTASNPEDPVERLMTTPSGQGYWIVQQNGTATAFGDATSRATPTTALLFSPVTPGDAAVLFAFQQLGKPYIWGGNGPVGYDCSGLALAAWTHGAGVEFARVADDQYHTAGVPVSMDALQAGDLVFWGTDLSDWTTVYHTAMYVGGGRIVEATGDVVQLNVLDQWGTSNLMPNGRRP
jgi:cell wall-associated NlpC family hydrolase